jgi:hypothetical protein
MAASAILLVDVAHDGPAALELFRCHSYRLALFNNKIHRTGGAEFSGQLKRGHALALGVTAFAAATVPAASRRQSAGPFQPVEIEAGPLA